MESLLDEVVVSSLQSSMLVRKDHNFLSDRCPSLNFSQEFPDAIFLGVDVASLLGEAVVSLLHTRVPVRKGITFDPTVGCPTNFHRVSGWCFSWSRCGIARR